MSYEINEKTFKKYPSSWKEKIKEESYSDKFILISKKPELWVYLGEHGDHLLVTKTGAAIYCSCKGFRMNLERKDALGCTHVYSLKISASLGRYRDISYRINKDDLHRIIEEILEVDYSYTLRLKLLGK